MGKTTEICNIGRILKEKDSSTWVIMVDLNQHTTLLSRDEINVEEFLQTVASLNTNFQKRLLEHQLHSVGNIVILLDGFDEISPDYSLKVFDLLTGVLTNKVKQIFITSRPVMRKELQNQLATLAFSFQSFTISDQKKFFMKYWNKNSVSSPKLSKFITALLQLLEKSLNDNLKEFTGIPLQTRMLAEIFQNEAINFCLTGEIDLPQSLDVLQLYDKFIDKKWEEYCKKLNLELNTTMLKQLIKKQKLQFLQMHMNCAIFSYLDENFIASLYSFKDIVKENKKFVETFKTGEEKTGLVTDIVNDRAVFIHRTFTEYFVATWFSKNFQTELNAIKKIYFNKNFEIVQKFLDRILAQNIELHTAVLNEDLPHVQRYLCEPNCDVNQKDKGGRSALQLAVMNCINTNYVSMYIINSLLAQGADVNCRDILNWSPLQLAVHLKAWPIVDKLLGKKANNEDLTWIKDNIEKLPRKIEKQLPKIDKRKSYVQSMTSYFETKNIEYHMSDLLEDAMRTALKKGYVNLVKFVLECGVSVEHRISDSDGYQTSMLHIAAKHKQFKVMKLVIEKGADIDVTGGRYNRTPLLYAAAYNNEVTAGFLIHHGASINARDEHGNTALLIAAGEGINQTLRLLLKKGADVEASDANSMTPLMRAAAYGYVEIAELLLIHGASVNAKNEDEETALLLAARMGKIDIVKLLLMKKADVEISGGGYNRTPLMEAAQSGHLKVIKMLLEHGACVNSMDEDGETALTLAVLNGHDDIENLLIQHGAHQDLHFY
ncbi:hypothetical protein L9F63_017300 [Diploptera punctata]|uniref:NACHT domain-containing protein n=1 Tax=Diploptera punctata TaxID=6984 RepID=A0AAD8EGH6_DIPPU|nr:hypothetical protein L9F63_017300 [Diploptera punctata]